MAARGTPVPGSLKDRQESLTCSMCLDIYTAPKLLPCSHTFCLQCLKELTSHLSSPSFPCPECRHDVEIPHGGVDHFQNNRYMRPEDLSAARDGTLCLTHPQQELDLYCTDCQVPVCLKCVLTKHRQHQTEDLPEAAKSAIAQLKTDDVRLKKSISTLATHVEADKQEEHALKCKKAAVETVIWNKHATLLAMADKVRDDLLSSLHTTTKGAETILTQELTTKTSTRQELRQLQQQVQQAISSGSGRRQLALAKEIRERTGSAQAVTQMTSAPRHVISRPLVSSSVTDGALMQHVTGFFGTVYMVEMVVMTPEVTVEEQFRCGTEADIEVLSLCPLDDGTGLLSYSRKGLSDHVPCEKFDQHANTLGIQTKIGRRSYTWRDKSKSMSIGPGPGGMRTHRKSHTESHLRLDGTTTGIAYLKKEKVLSERPLKSESTIEFSIKAGPHRAMGVDPSDQLLAVVEEPLGPDVPRTVKLFRRPQQDPVATYAPPTTPFNPSDVCFYRLGGRHVLLIADEAGDSIHVVQAEGGAMTFLRHLAPGCPVLVQPTALNTDHLGRLWVACRGGAIITMTPTAK